MSADVRKSYAFPYVFDFSAAAPPVFAVKNVRQRWRRSREEGSKPNGKTQPQIIELNSQIL